MATAADVKIEFRAGVNYEGVIDRTIEFMKRIGFESGNKAMEVSSAARSPYDQARVMYDNCANLGKNPKLGVASQYKLYGRNGDHVIDVFVSGTKQKRSKAQIIADMQAKIVAIGPSKVSKHCVDTTIMNVLDIPFSSITNKKEFRNALKKYSPYPISRYLDENNNACFHLEFKLADVNNFFDSIELEKGLAKDGFRLA